MNGEKLLKFLISFLIILQVLGFVFKNFFLNTYVPIILSIVISVLYVVSTKRIRISHVLVLLTLIVSEFIVFYRTSEVIKYQMITRIIGYILLFYFLYYNHRSFLYNKRDVFTLVLGSSLYTIIFIMAYVSLKDQMGDLRLIGFLNLLLLYILLIVGAMHYINIRSEKSLWFFLSMLNFSFSDFMLLIDTFYLHSYELELLMLICRPLAMTFLVNYMVTKTLVLRAQEFEGF